MNVMALREDGVSVGLLKQNLGWMAVAVALVAATHLAAASWERVKTRPPDRTIRVTGSAKKRIVSDLIEWTAELKTEHKSDKAVAYRALHAHVERVMAYLKEQGVKPAETTSSSVKVEALNETEVEGKGENRLEKEVFKSWQTSQFITVHSADVARIERISREVTALLQEGVPVSSLPPTYYYTKLGEMKIAMLAEAAKDARVRAENMLRSTGGAAIHNLRSADMGIINVNAVNDTNTSAEGNNDTSSLEKDIMTIVHVTYEVQ